MNDLFINNKKIDFKNITIKTLKNNYVFDVDGKIYYGSLEVIENPRSLTLKNKNQLVVINLF